MKKLFALLFCCVTVFMGYAKSEKDDFVGVIDPYSGSAERNFEIYRDALQRVDVTIRCPETYTAVPIEVEGRREFFRNIGYYRCDMPTVRYVVGFESSDGNAVMLYPSTWLTEGLTDDAYRLGAASLEGEAVSIGAELRTAYRNADLDIVPLVEVIANDDMSQYANADTVAFYQFSLDKVGINYMDKNNHCVGVYLRKIGHPALLLKLMLNDEGYQNKDKYLRDMLGSVHYGDNNTQLSKYEARNNYGLAYRLNQKVEPCGPTSGEDYDMRISALREKYEAENDSLNSLRQ